MIRSDFQTYIRISHFFIGVMEIFMLKKKEISLENKLL